MLASSVGTMVYEISFVFYDALLDIRMELV